MQNVNKCRLYGNVIVWLLNVHACQGTADVPIRPPDRWETEEVDPAGRLRKFIHILLTNRVDILSYGCPVGTLTTELAKLRHSALAQADTLFVLFRTWLRDQFVLLGHEE